MYIKLPYLPLFNFANLFFLSFLSFLSTQHISLIVIALFPNWHLSLVLLSRLCFSQFCSGRYNFWFALLTGSNFYTLFLLGSFDFAYGGLCICVYSVTLLSVVTNLCIYTGLLQFCGVFLYFFLFFFLLPFFFLLYNFNF